MMPYKLPVSNKKGVHLVDLSSPQILRGIIKELRLAAGEEELNKFIERVKNREFGFVTSPPRSYDDFRVSEQVIFDTNNAEYLYYNITLQDLQKAEQIVESFRYSIERVKEINEIIRKHIVNKIGEIPLQLPFPFLYVIRTSPNENELAIAGLKFIREMLDKDFPHEKRLVVYAPDGSSKPLDRENPVFATNLSALYLLDRELNVREGTKIVFIVPENFLEGILFKFSIPIFKLLFNIRGFHETINRYHDKLSEYIGIASSVDLLEDLDKLIRLEYEIEDLINELMLHDTQLHFIFSKLDSVKIGIEKSLMLKGEELDHEQRLKNSIAFLNRVFNEVKEAYDLVVFQINEVINNPLHRVLSSYVRTSNIRYKIVKESFKQVDLFIRSHQNLSSEVIDAVNSITSIVVQYENIYWNPIFNRCWFFVDHGLKHALRTLGRFAELIIKLTDGRADLIFNDLEYLAVFIGVLFHDIGLFIPIYRDCETIRRNHGTYSYLLIYEKLPNFKEDLRIKLEDALLTNLLRIHYTSYRPLSLEKLRSIIDAILYIAATIAKYHQSSERIENLENDYKLKESFLALDQDNDKDEKWLHKARITILLLRLADECDLGWERAFVDLYERIEFLIKDEIKMLCNEARDSRRDNIDDIRKFINLLCQQFIHYRKSQYIDKITFSYDRRSNVLGIFIKPKEDVAKLPPKEEEFYNALSVAYLDIKKEISTELIPILRNSLKIFLGEEYSKLSIVVDIEVREEESQKKIKSLKEELDICLANKDLNECKRKIIEKFSENVLRSLCGRVQV